MTPTVATRTVLENGAVMARAEFHELYEQCEDLHRVELIEGVVYMPSPIMILGHADEQGLMLDWLSAYAASHPGVKHSPPGTVLMDDENEPEPDAMLYRVTPNRYKDGYLKGAPELIVATNLLTVVFIVPAARVMTSFSCWLIRMFNRAELFSFMLAMA